MTSVRSLQKRRGQQRLGIVVILALLGATANFGVQLGGVLNPQPQPLTRTPGTSEGPAPDPDLPPEKQPIQQLQRTQPLTTRQVQDLFQGGAFRSLASRVIGAAEGTRTPDGGKTMYWYGHRDPGDSLWNYGTFSYSFQRHGMGGGKTPERADRIYFQQLLKRLPTLLAQVRAAGTELNLEEWLNFIDLRNQAPQAALGWSRRRQNPGYVANLIEMKQRGLKGQTAIIHARVECFRDQTTGIYQAWTDRSGLFRDQGRRSEAIRSTLAIWQRQMNGVQPVSLLQSPKLDSLLQSNPYGITWSTVDQKTDSLYWQQGVWDALNRIPSMSSDPAYGQGYALGQGELGR